MSSQRIFILSNSINGFKAPFNVVLTLLSELKDRVVGHDKGNIRVNVVPELLLHSIILN